MKRSKAYKSPLRNRSGSKKSKVYKQLYRNRHGGAGPAYGTSLIESKYTPHQGAQEKVRRKRQMALAAGMVL